MPRPSIDEMWDKEFGNPDLAAFSKAVSKQCIGRYGKVHLFQIAKGKKSFRSLVDKLDVKSYDDCGMMIRTIWPHFYRLYLDLDIAAVILATSESHELPKVLDTLSKVKRLSSREVLARKIPLAELSTLREDVLEAAEKAARELFP